MNILLIPYTWHRHIVVGLFCAGAGLLAWWALLCWIVALGPSWPPAWDGAVMLCALGTVVCTTSVVGESSLRRRSLPGHLLLATSSAAISAGLGLAAYWLWTAILAPGILAPLVSFATENLGMFRTGLENGASASEIRALLEAVSADVADPGLVSLRYRLGAFVTVGLATSTGPAVVRKFKGLHYHLAAGAAAGLLAASVWHLLSYVFGTDLYLASAGASITWGFVFGAFAWPLPDELYAAWLRVLSRERFGHRVPIDSLDRAPTERFVGHYPTGLDLFLPSSAGVSELHVSVVVDQDQRYHARGLTLEPTTVHRFLERLDLRYDPGKPTPLETRLLSGDRLVLGDGANSTVLEMIMLPRQED